MKLEKVYVHNFRPIGEATLNLDSRGVILVTGDNHTATEGISANGTGKSSLLDAIFWAIYGKLPNGDAADKVVNRIAKKDTEVKLWFSIGKHHYLIDRGRKKNFVKLFQDDQDISTSSAKKTDALITDTIGISDDVFLSTIFFDGANSIPFSKLTDKQRKEFLETVVNIGVYREAHDKVKDTLKDLTTEQEVLKSKREAMVQTLTAFKETESERSKNMTTLKESLSKAQKKLTDAKNLFNKKKPTFDAQLDKIDKLIENIKVTPSVSDTLTKYQDLVVRLTKAKENGVSLNNQLKDTTSSLQQLKDEYESLNNSKTCPVCGNPLDESHRLAEQQRITEKVTPLVEKYHTDEQSLKDKRAEYVSLQKQVSETKEVADKEKQKEATLRNSLEQAYQQRTDISNQVSKHTQAISLAESEVSSYERQLKSLEQESYTEKIADCQETIKGFETKLQDTLVKIDDYNEAEKAFSDKGIKSHVLDLIMPLLNDGVNKYLEVLTGSTISVMFSTQSAKIDGTLADKLDVRVTNKGFEADYSTLSSGEQRRVDIAIGLALQDLVMSRSNLSFNVLFYDELFDSLDSTGVEKVVELLNQRLSTASSIFVISHDTSLKALFDKSITMVMNNGMSELKEEN